MLWSLLVILVIATFLMTILIRTFKLPQLPRERAQSFVERACRGPIAHRCGKPENTLVAITLSHENGASGIEVDLTFSKDGHPVLLHDSRIDRTSNGRGRVQDMTLNQLKKLDFGVKTGGLVVVHLPEVKKDLICYEYLGIQDTNMYLVIYALVSIFMLWYSSSYNNY